MMTFTSFDRFYRLFPASVLALVTMVCGVSHAQDTAPRPQRPVRIVVPYAAGASTDNVTRYVAQTLSKRIGQSFIVENRPGAMGTIGTLSVLREKPDGYTLAASDTTAVIIPHVMKNMPHDTARDLIPIAAYVFSPFGIVVTTSSPYKRLQDLISDAKARPGKLTFGSGGAGSSPHLATEEFAIATGIKLFHIPYKGAGAAVIALLGGTLDMQFVSPSTALGNVKGGKLRMLAISGDTRIKALPDVPTFSEAGVKGFSASNWIGLFAPKGTPPVVIERLRKEVAAIMATAEMKAYAENLGAPTRSAVGKDFVKLFNEDSNRMKTVIEKIGLDKRTL